MVRAAALTAVTQRGVYFLQPLVVESAELLVECTVADGRFDVRSGVELGAADVSVHCSGALATSQKWQIISQASVRGRSCLRSADICPFYDGFEYGPTYRTLMQAWRGGGDVLARLRERAAHEGTQVHPADLDDALRSSALAVTSNGEMRLPFAVDDAQLKGADNELWAVRSHDLLRCLLRHLHVAKCPCSRVACACACAPIGGGMAGCRRCVSAARWGGSTV
jgi:hypothetical protein